MRLRTMQSQSLSRISLGLFQLGWLSGPAANYGVALSVILALNFILPRLMPGDPLQAIYGDEALMSMSPEMEAALIERFALDCPWHDQFVAYILGLLRGDLGYSYYYGDQVVEVILAFLPWTLLLTGTALVISTALGLVLGIESGYRQGRTLDRSLLGGLMFLSGFPDFFVGILMLLFFGVSLGLMPLGGATTSYAGLTGVDYILDVLHHMVLPVSALVLVHLAPSYLLTRSAMVSTLKEPFLTTARAKGCSDMAIRYRHAGRNSLLPVVTATGVQVPQILVRTLLIEIVFSYPGMGLLLQGALMSRDYPLIQGILLMVTLTVLTANLAVDTLYRRLDPRVGNAH